MLGLRPSGGAGGERRVLTLETESGIITVCLVV